MRVKDERSLHVSRNPESHSGLISLSVNAECDVRKQDVFQHVVRIVFMLRLKDRNRPNEQSGLKCFVNKSASAKVLINCSCLISNVFFSK